LRTSLEVADIFRAEGAGYRAVQAGHLSLTQLKVMLAIENCRTAALGGHVDACEDCGHCRIAYNSCLMGKISNGESAAAPRRIPAVFGCYGAASLPHVVPISPDLPGDTIDLAASSQ
jgi:hypothetical protein